MDEARKNQLEARFYKAILSGSNLNAFCGCVSEETGNPVSIHLPSRTIIAKSPDYSRDLVEDFVNAFSMSPPDATRSLFNSIIDKLKNRHAFAEAFPYYRFMQVLCGCFHNNHIAAILDCPIVNSADIDVTKEILELAARPAAILLQLNNYVSSISVHHMQIYLSTLLKVKKPDLYQQLSVTGSAIDGTESWRLLWLHPENIDSAGRLISDVDRFCAVKEKIWCTEHEGNMVLLMDSSLASKIGRLHDLCSGYATMVISEPFMRLEQVYDTCRHCQLAYRIARFEDNESSLIYVLQYKTPIYFLYLYTSDLGTNWGSSDLDRIKQYDMEHGTDYYSTVRAFLLCSGDYSLMSEKLHVHKNTVIYRIQRIIDYFGINLKDIRVTSNLYLSLFTALLTSGR